MLVGRSAVVFVRIMRGTELMFELPVEIGRPDHLAEGARDALELFRAQHPDTSLVDGGISITFMKDTSGA